MPMFIVNVAIAGLFLFSSLCSMYVYANDNTGPQRIVTLNTSTERNLYREMIAELRCPKCQNQNLADSDAPIAKDLRGELVRLIKEGSDEQQIKAFMVRRYGDFVLYDPPKTALTSMLWLLPLGVVVIGMFMILKPNANNSRKNIDVDEGKIENITEATIDVTNQDVDRHFDDLLKSIDNSKRLDR